MPDLYHSFLRACLRFDGERAGACLWSPHWNWERLFRAANHEAVLPAIASFLGQHPDIPVPPEIRDFLSAVLFLNRDRNQRIQEQASSACRLLNEAGMEPVLLKGMAYLAAGVYPDAGVRYLIDADLLLPQVQLEPAAGILLSDGYTQNNTDPFAPFLHHRPSLRRPGAVPLELHRDVGLGPCRKLLPAREIIERSTPHDLDGVRVRLPCLEHLVTHLIVHSQIQHPYRERIWPPLRTMRDLVQLQRHFGASIPWANIENRFRRAGQLGLLRLYLADVRDALGFEPPIPIPLTGVTRLRWHRRRILRRFPALRYFDPVYLFSTICRPRLRILGRILDMPGEWIYLVNRLVGLNFIADMIASAWQYLQYQLRYKTTGF